MKSKLSSLLFIIISSILSYVLTPYILSSLIDPSGLNTFSRNTRTLNEFYIEVDNKPISTIKQVKLSYFMDCNGDNHILLPVYRALKLGVHVTNLGYNEGMFDEYTNKTNTVTQFYRQNRWDKQELSINYKSLYSTPYNNVGVLIYEYIASKIQKINNAEDEIKAQKIMTNIRYLFFLTFLIPLWLLFVFISVQFGVVFAWAIGIAFLINPSMLYITVTSANILTMNFIEIVYVLFFYKSLINKQFHHKIMFYIGFIILVTVHQYFSGVATLLFSVLPSLILLLYYLLIYDNYLITLIKNFKKYHLYKKLFYFSANILFLGVFIIAASYVLRTIEANEGSLLYGEDIRKYSSALKSISQSFYFDSGDIWYKRIYLQQYHFWRNLLTDPWIIIQYWIFNETISNVLDNLFKIISFVTILSFTVFRIIKVKYFTNNYFWINILIACVLWVMYMFFLNLISPWFMSHKRFNPIFSTQITMILFLIFSLILKDIVLYYTNNKKDKINGRKII